ncbi:hypothetical protein ASPACDRAFT_45639 [Aspergillus aculeatus ATCC 16872]|uniref:Uncharacterized protein n=1 Tax=Aspergillus aculeatus (strain ATCC 16872 / CBS 172.66 / WB 5094) TaxID=690307 RepID=A0A1L9WN21_ASPA1|nr:uncharacterized protein ASPACDRAFT_45639 [Aspergillus aculeatus ATCC 16872]OJJ97546.1 hypothetical protein ASPACDRAFT_45639 [Aspergillus aculeatus ATCC 16872]
MSDHHILDLPVPPQDVNEYGWSAFEDLLLSHMLKSRAENPQLMIQFGFIRSGSWVHIYREFTPEENRRYGDDGLQRFGKYTSETDEIRVTFHLERDRKHIDEYVYMVVMPWLRTSEVTIWPVGTGMVWHWKK